MSLLEDRFEAASELRERNALEEALVAFKSIARELEGASEIEHREVALRALRKAGATLNDLERFDEELDVYDDVLAREGEARERPLRFEVSWSLDYRAMTLHALGRHAEEVRVRELIDARDRQAVDAEFREHLANNLLDLAIAAGEVERVDSQLAAYDQVVEREGGAREYSLRWCVVRALGAKAFILDKLGRHEDELQARELIVQRELDAPELEMRVQVAQQLVGVGITLNQLERQDDALTAYCSVLTQYGDDSETVVRLQVVRALEFEAKILKRLGRFSDELAVWKRIAEREQDATEPKLYARAARALVNSGLILIDLGRNDEARAIYQHVVAKYDAVDDPEIANQSSRAMALEAEFLDSIGDADSARAARRALIDRYRGSADARVRRRVAEAVVTRSGLLWTSGRTADALNAVREMPTFDGAIDARLAETIARARVNEGIFLAALDQHAEAHAIFEEIMQLAVGPDEDGLIEDVLRAASNDSISLRALGRPDAALKCLRTAIERFRDVRGEKASPLLASAMIDYGSALAEGGRDTDALTVYDEAIAFIEGSGRGDVRTRLDPVQIAKAKVMQKRGEHAAAAELYTAVFDRGADAVGGPSARTAAWAGVQAMYGFHKARRLHDTVRTAQALKSRYSKAGDPHLRARARNAWTVATVMPRVMRAIDSVERHPRRYGVVAVTASAAAAAAWARRRAGRS